MLHYKVFPVNPLQENCYVVWDDTKQGIIIDCGAMTKGEQSELAQYIQSMGITPRMALQTHLHFDHIFGLDFILNTYSIKAMCHELDIPVFDSSGVMSRAFFDFDLELSNARPDTFLKDGDELHFGETTVKVLHTPGHTPGGLCFYFPQAGLLFSGDTIFCGSMGRTDFPGGSLDQEIESISTKILTLPADTTILPGHGPATTVKAEKPFYQP